MLEFFSLASASINNIRCYANTTIVKTQAVCRSKKVLLLISILGSSIVCIFFSSSIISSPSWVSKEKAVCLLFSSLFLFQLNILRVRQIDKRISHLFVCVFSHFLLWVQFFIVARYSNASNITKWKMKILALVDTNTMDGIKAKPLLRNKS